MYRNYIFDLDGTLLDTLEDLANAVNYSLSQMNYPVHTIDEIRSYIGNGIRMLIRRAVPQETDEGDYNKTLSVFKEYYLAHIADFTKPYDGIINVLDELKSKGCALAVVSNKSDDAAKAVVETFFGNRFDMVIGKMDCFPTKPEPDSVLYVMETLGLNKNETVYIGDSEVDVQTAHNASLQCIGVTWGNRDKEELISNGAEFIAEAPEDILKAKF